MPSKTTLIRSGIAIVVLVAAILTGSLFARSKRPPTPKIITLTSEQQAAQDYDQALGSLSKDDTATAMMLLERAVKLDPNNQKAKTKLSELQKSNKTTQSENEQPSTPTTTPANPNAPDPFLGDIAIKKLLPKSLEGFSLGAAQIIEPDGTVSGEPNVAGSVVSNVLWAVHDRGSSEKAKAFVDSLSSGPYPQDKASVNIKGVTGTFSTDGTRFASLAFVRGRYAFEVTLTSSGPPVNTKSLAEKAASAFPTAP